MTKLPLGAFVVGIVASVLAPGLRADEAVRAFERPPGTSRSAA